ncbi:pentatricopeptide repeat-containing protein At3g49170, chloroplastic-like [Eucalyptus grandis]|uniref:pentatricopeptide repeat-containing protein At3g49170, chloroplastic-like n=1 Tax=Eucalyptus grandis TaxID=71139 RepID=UPI00192E9340|nr:pentatricopeptide repeat-containing protein At3g49170, chloroplastic-like [Eucalyptus grandis]
MLVGGTVAYRSTLNAVLSACSELELPLLGVQLHSWVIQSGLALDVCVGCSLADMYVKFVAGGSLHDSRKVQVRPNHFAFASVHKACGSTRDVDMGIQIYALAIKLGFAGDTCVDNSLISMNSWSGHMEDTQRAFDVLFEKNLISSSTFVDAYAKSLESDQAFELLHEIERGIGTSAFTFASLLSGAACISAIGKGRQIHTRMVKSGLDSNQVISNALAPCIQGVERENIRAWTTMITGFPKHGFVARTLETFCKMLEAGVRQNVITCVAVLAYCSSVGLISDE